MEGNVMLSHDNIGGKLEKIGTPEAAPPGDNFHIRIKPSAVFTRDLSLAIGQLRAAHAQLVAGTVANQKEFADRMIAPQIERIDKVLRRLA
jgi:hypothetical protein